METHKQRNIKNSRTKCIKHLGWVPRKFTCRILTRSKSWTNHNAFENKSNRRPTIISWRYTHITIQTNQITMQSTYIIKVSSPICTLQIQKTKVEYLFCYCITYSNKGLYHKISLFFDLLTTWILTWCFCNDHLDDATFTFISTVSIAVTCSLYPAIHTIFLLLTQPYRPVLDKYNMFSNSILF